MDAKAGEVDVVVYVPRLTTPGVYLSSLFRILQTWLR